MSIQAAQINPIDSAIEAICLGKHSNTQNKKIAKIALLGIGCLASIAAKYFFYPVANEGGTSIFGVNSAGDAFGYVFEVFYSKAFFTLEILALYGILDTIISNRSQEEQEARQKTSIAGKVVLVILTVSAAVFARYPFALPAAQYNKVAPIAALISSLCASLVLPIRSIQLTIGQLVGIRNCSCNSKIASAKKKFVSRLEQTEATLSTKNLQELSAIQNDIDISSENSKTLNCLSKYLAQNNGPSKAATALWAASLAITLPLTGILEYAIADYTYYTTKELVLDSTPLAVTLAATSGLVTFYFYGKAIYESSYRFFRLMTNRCNSAPSYPLMEKIAPVTANVLKAEEFASNFFAIGPWYSVWGNFYKAPVSHWFFSPLLLLTLYMTLQASSCAVIDNIGLSFVKNEDGRQAIKLISNLKRIKETIGSSNDDQFLAFFSSLPENMKKQLLPEEEINAINEIRPLVV